MGQYGQQPYLSCTVDTQHFLLGSGTHAIHARAGATEADRPIGRHIYSSRLDFQSGRHEVQLLACVDLT